ncbi:MAG: Polynucleotide adenylyltransferase region [Bryobacterales bacterium]|nr:Polynucleotide adenylyltransferase region [Bryobacterales bacterium]
MSDYIYSLESHLTAGQNGIVAHWQAAATAANQNLYLAGGAMRDLLGGLPTRDLDFTLEGNPLKMAAEIAGNLNGRIVSQDDHRRVVEMIFPGGITVQAAMARQERYAKTGAKPQVTPSSIHDDLRRRDFTIDAIALALNRGAKGLLIDPANGLADLANRELRTTNSYALYDDPSRLLRLIRLKHRLQFTVQERTAQQFQNALDENLHRFITQASLLEEFRHIADEPSPSEILRDLESSGLLALFSKALAGPKLNLAAVTKLERLKKSLPLGGPGWLEGWRSFLNVVTEKLSPREKTELHEALGISKQDVESAKKVPVQAKKLETSLKSATLRKPSQIYQLLAHAAPDEILYTLYESQQRLVQDRIRNYIQKYLPMAQEITDAEVVAAGGAPGSPKFEKIRENLIVNRLNARPKKVEPEPIMEVPALSAPRGRPARQA